MSDVFLALFLFVFLSFSLTSSIGVHDKKGNVKKVFSNTFLSSFLNDIKKLIILLALLTQLCVFFSFKCKHVVGQVRKMLWFGYDWGDF